MRDWFTTVSRFCAVLGSVSGIAAAGTLGSMASSLLLISLFLPLVAFLIDHYRAYLASAVVCSAGMLLGACGVVSWPINLCLASISLLLLTAISSLNLAVEDVALRVASDILSEKHLQSQTMSAYTVDFRIICCYYAFLRVS